MTHDNPAPIPPQRGPSLLAARTPWIALTVAILLGQRSEAGPWPQILGPNRDGHAVGERLPDRWPEGGPPVIWQQPVGSGYAGPAIVGDRALLFHRIDNQERLEARSTTDGSILWQRSFSASYQPGVNPDNGPRCVPLVVQSRVICFGAAGDLHCVQLQSGRVHWSRQLAQDYQAGDGYFGAGATPVAIGDLLVINVGGKGNAGFVAVNLNDGKTRWTAVRQDASYSSPVTLKFGQRQQLVGLARLELVVLDPADGSVIARHPFGQRGATVNAANPVLFGHHIFVTASYGIGATLLRLDANRLDTVWSNDQSLSSQYNTPIYHDGYLYGIHGREDLGVADLRCIQAETGKVQWTQPGFGTAHLIHAHGKLLALTTEGRLCLIGRDPSRFRLLGQASISDATTRAHPALSDGRFYFRDNVGNNGKLYCLQVGQPLR